RRIHGCSTRAADCKMHRILPLKVSWPSCLSAIAGEGWAMTLFFKFSLPQRNVRLAGLVPTFVVATADKQDAPATIFGRLRTPKRIRRIVPNGPIRRML